MFTPAKLAVLLTAALSVAAMPSHVGRNLHNHREIAARVPQPEAVPVVEIAARDIPGPANRLVRRRRTGNGHCSEPSGSGVVPSPTIKGDPKPSSEPAPSQSTPALNGALNIHNTPSENSHTTSKEDPKPSTSSTHEQPDPTTPTPTSTPTSTPDSGTGGGDTYTGQGTFYGTGLGACGITNNDSQDIAAVSHLFYDSYPGYDGSNPNKNPLCGKTAKVTYKGKTVTVQLTDRCGSCAYGDLDFSPHAFNQLADPAEGRISGISWQITD